MLSYILSERYIPQLCWLDFTLNKTIHVSTPFKSSLFNFKWVKWQLNITSEFFCSLECVFTARGWNKQKIVSIKTRFWVLQHQFGFFQKSYRVKNSWCIKKFIKDVTKNGSEIVSFRISCKKYLCHIKYLYRS